MSLPIWDFTACFIHGDIMLLPFFQPATDLAQKDPDLAYLAEYIDHIVQNFIRFEDAVSNNQIRIRRIQADIDNYTQLFTEIAGEGTAELLTSIAEITTRLAALEEAPPDSGAAQEVFDALWHHFSVFQTRIDAVIALMAIEIFELRTQPAAGAEILARLDTLEGNISFINMIFPRMVTDLRDTVTALSAEFDAYKQFTTMKLINLEARVMALEA